MASNDVGSVTYPTLATGVGIYDFNFVRELIADALITTPGNYFMDFLYTAAANSVNISLIVPVYAFTVTPGSPAKAGAEDSARHRHVIDSNVDPRCLSRMTSCDVGSTIHQSL